MTDEETLIVNFLKASPESSYSRREIARRAVKRRVFEENPNWANAALEALLGRGVIERDMAGYYRLKKDQVLSRG